MRTIFRSLIGLLISIQIGCGGSSDGDDMHAGGGSGGHAGTGGSAGDGGSAGTGGSGGTGQTVGIALADLAAQYVQATCGAFDRCAGPELTKFVLGGADCTTHLTARVEDGEFNLLEDAVQNGTVLYDAAAAPACIDAIETTPCDQLTGVSPDACEQAIAGTVSLGGSCELDQECIGADTYCRIDAGCPGTCVTRLAAGATCGADHECQGGLECFRGTCLAPPTAAQTCGGNVAPDCTLGLVCIGDDPDTLQTGTCGDPASVFSQMPGADCSLATDQLCVFGAYCAVTGATQSGITTLCKQPATSGGACNLAFPDMCPDGEYCSVTVADIQGGVYDGTCVALPGEGEACVQTFGKTCAPDAACVDNICRTLRRLGDPCIANAACYSGNCSSGVCAAPDPCTG